jgi:tRNA (guanine-N7-)-methyltransferase
MALFSKLKHFRHQIKKLITRSLYSLRGKMRAISFEYSKENVKDTDVHDLPFPVKWDKVSEGKPLLVDIGSGHGEVLWSLSQTYYCVGFEIKSRFYRYTSAKLRRKLSAVLYKGDAYTVIPYIFSEKSIQRITILFPDPWHKKRHNKRRPITATWMRAVRKHLKDDGDIVIATDWQDYADFIATQVDKVSDIYDVETGEYSPQKFGLPETHYYKKWVRQNRSFTYFHLKKK